MPKTSLSLADIATAYINGEGTRETLEDLRNLTLRTEVLRTILEQASADPDVIPTNMRDVVKTIVTSWLPEEEATTGEAAPSTLDQALALLNVRFINLPSRAVIPTISWLVHRDFWFIVQPYGCTYRIFVQEDNWEALTSFVHFVLDPYFS